MKTLRLLRLVVVLALMTWSFALFALSVRAHEPPASRALAPAAPAGGVLTTAINYQGRLQSGGAPVNATCDFVFGLYDSLTAGLQIGGAVNRTLSVSGGLFSAALDFGAGTFNGQARWLDIQVRCPAGSGVYTPLAPREVVMPAPYALSLPAFTTQVGPLTPSVIGNPLSNTLPLTVSGGVMGGGWLNAILNDYSTVGGGGGNTANGYAVTVSGGAGNMASGSYAAVPGGLQAFARDYGQLAYASGAFYYAAPGTAQHSVHVLRNVTAADGLTVTLYTDGSSGLISVPAHTALVFRVLVTGITNDDWAGAWEFRGMIRNSGGALTQGCATMTCIPAPPQKTVLTSLPSGEDVSVEADGLNSTLLIRVKGNNSHPMRWVATLETTEAGW